MDKPVADRSAEEQAATEAACVIAAVLVGAATWLIVAGSTGRREAWDSGSFWVYGYLVMAAVAGVLGFACPRTSWRWGLLVIAAQPPILFLQSGLGNLWPLTIAIFALMAIPLILMGVAGGAFRKRLDRMKVNTMRVRRADLHRPVRSIVEALVNGDYERIVQMTRGVRLPEEELRAAVREYPGKLIMPPSEAFDEMEIVEGPDPTREWVVIMDLWTEEEDQSDLSLELTIRRRNGDFAIELDDLHVM